MLVYGNGTAISKTKMTQTFETDTCSVSIQPQNHVNTKALKAHNMYVHII